MLRSRSRASAINLQISRSLRKRENDRGGMLWEMHGRFATFTQGPYTRSRRCFGRVNSHLAKQYQIGLFSLFKTLSFYYSQKNEACPLSTFLRNRTLSFSFLKLTVNLSRACAEIYGSLRLVSIFFGADPIPRAFSQSQKCVNSRFHSFHRAASPSKIRFAKKNYSVALFFLLR